MMSKRIAGVNKLDKMKRIIALAILILAVSPAFASNEIEKDLLQKENPMKIHLTDVWIQDHFEAKIIGNQIQVLTSEPAYEDANVTLVNALTGYEYSFSKDQADSRLNISNLPKGTYLLKISEDLLYECMTKIRIG